MKRISSREKVLSFDPLPDEEVLRLFAIIKDGYGTLAAKTARDTIILHCTRFVSYRVQRFAKRYSAYRYDSDDLFSEGIIGVIKAIPRFDPRKGRKFIDYASFHIDSRIIRYIDTHRRTIRVPQHCIDAYALTERVSSLLRSEIGREPSIKEIAEAACVSELNLTNLLVKQEMIPFSTPIESSRHEDENDSPWLNDPLYLCDTLQDPHSEDFFGKIDNEETSRVCKVAMTYLRPRQREILELHYGSNHKSVKDLADIYKLTRERIRQIIFDALKLLRVIIEELQFCSNKRISCDSDLDSLSASRYRTSLENNHPFWPTIAR